jgi:hypothetical protein
MTVPMSRPSSTAPGPAWAANFRWKSSRGPTPGITATFDARHASYGLGAQVGGIQRVVQDARHRGAAASDALGARSGSAFSPTPGRAPGIEMRQAEMPARRRASVPLPAPAGPSMAMTRPFLSLAAQPAPGRHQPGKLVSMAPSSTWTPLARPGPAPGRTWRCGGPDACRHRPPPGGGAPLRCLHDQGIGAHLVLRR